MFNLGNKYLKTALHEYSWVSSPSNLQTIIQNMFVTEAKTTQNNNAEE